MGLEPSITADPPAQLPAAEPTPSRLARVLLAAVIVASAVVGLAFSGLVLLQHRRGSIAGFGSVSQLGGIERPWWLHAGAAVAAVAIAALLVRRQGLLRSTTAGAAAIAALAVALLANAAPLAHFVALTAIALASALVIGLQLPLSRTGDAAPSRRTELLLAGSLWLLVTVVMSIFALHRHWSFGSGSWDMGCMVHNFYRASRFLDTTSTVLGNVDFLGDHFMAGIYLYAPLFWLTSSGTTLILVQSVNLAAVAPVVYALARDHSASRAEAIALALAGGLAFGMQSAAYFDSHEITVGFGFLCFGVWALEKRRLVLATVLLFVFITFKESLGAYLIALGMLAIWRGVRDRDRRLVRFGALWIVLGAVWFVLVNRVFMPALIARANAPEPHETFGDFGPTVFTAMTGVLKDPLKAFGALFVPDEKLESQLVTLGGIGWLALASPELLIAALPLVAERFLSSKSTMWEMGYHYAAPLTFYTAWAVAIGWARIKRAAERALSWLGGAPLAAGAPAVLAVYVIAMAALINSVGYRHPANFHRWEMDYFSTEARQASNQRAVELLEDQGRDAKLAVQNRILPHLADRPHIYRLGDWAQADWVLLSMGENAWPWDDGFPRRLARQLHKDAGWRLVFADGDALIFVRAQVSALPAVPPPPSLGP